MPGSNIVTRALTAAAGVAVGAWVVDRITKSITTSIATVLNEAVSSVDGVTQSLSRLVLPYETHEQVPQQELEDWSKGDILTPAEQFERSLDGTDDWTDTFDAEQDPRPPMERPIIPLEDQLAQMNGLTGLAAPDLAGEDL